MAQRYIKDEFWTDPYIESLDPSEKLLFLYLLTNPLCNIAGIYEIRVNRIAYETGFDKDMVEKILSRFENDKKIIRSDSFIILVNFIKNQSNNPSVLLGIQRILDSLPTACIQAVTACPTLLNYTLLNLKIPDEKFQTENSLKKKLAIARTPLEDLRRDSSTGKSPRDFLNARRAERGKPPMTPRRSPKQQNTLKAFKEGIEYFKKVGKEKQGMDFLANPSQKRNSIVRKLVISAQEEVEDLKLLIDWWFSNENGKWALYEPEQCFSNKTIERYKNSTITPKQKYYA